MTELNKIFNRLKWDKRIGIICFFIGVITSFLIPKDKDLAFKIVSFTPIVLCFILSAVLYFPADPYKDNLVTNFKVDLGIKFLLQQTNNQITPEHCFQIIKNTNSDLSFEFLPAYRDIKDFDYTIPLREHVKDRWTLIKHPSLDSEINFVNKILIQEESFLTLPEKEILSKKLAFYSY